MIKEIIGSIIITGCLGIQQPPVKNVSYDDISHSITLSADELNNYTFTNLGAYFVDNVNGAVVFDYIAYNHLFGTYPNVYVVDENDGATLTLLNEDNVEDVFYSDIIFDYEEGLCIFSTYSTYDSNIYESFLDSIIISVNSLYFDDVKSAIELDIEANLPEPEPEPVPTSSNIYSIIYDFFSDYVFTSTQLDTITDNTLGLTFNEWLCHSATIFLLALGVLWLILVVRWIFRVFSGLVNV